MKNFYTDNEYVGEYVTCLTDKLRDYKKGYIYKIVKSKAGYKGQFTKGRDAKIKLEGFKTFQNYWNFEETDVKILRANKLRIISGDVSFVSNKPLKSRKFDSVGCKNYKLMELILNRISRDRNRLGYGDYNGNGYYDTFDEMIKIIAKGEKVLGVECDDFSEISDMKISDFFDIFISERKKDPLYRCD